jgi:undecaprenyl diphosphate synthase
MTLLCFMLTMKTEVKRLHKNKIRLRFIGERADFSEKIQQKMAESEQLTENNTGLTLVIAANYGGHRDMTLAIQDIAQQVKDGIIAPDGRRQFSLLNAKSVKT